MAYSYNTKLLVLMGDLTLQGQKQYQVVHGFVNVEDGSTVLTIPIEDDYIPNVHIQVDLVGATMRTDDNGDPLPDAPDRPAPIPGAR